MKILSQVKSLEDIVSSIKGFLGRPEDIVLYGRVVNVFVEIRTEAPLLTRTEGTGDITVFNIGGFNVPAILDTKFRAILRRKTLQLLRLYWPENEKLCYLGFKKTGEVEAYCGNCPACMIYGFAAEGGDYNVKSRVEGDVYYATIPEGESVIKITRNAVDEATYTTGQALFEELAVKPGVIFVGKLALKNLTPAEFKLVLYSLASIDRVGAVQTHFGRVSIRIPGIIASNYEVGSGYEAALRILSQGVREEKDISGMYTEYIKWLAENHTVGVAVVAESIRDIILRENFESIAKSVWSDAKRRVETIRKLVSAKK